MRARGCDIDAESRELIIVSQNVTMGLVALLHAENKSNSPFNGNPSRALINWPHVVTCILIPSPSFPRLSLPSFPLATYDYWCWVIITVFHLINPIQITTLKAQKNGFHSRM